MTEFVDTVPRVDIPGDLVHFVVEADKAFLCRAVFTRDPAAITRTQILMPCSPSRASTQPYGVRRLNHGIGFNTAAIELLLPTYGGNARPEGQDRTHWALNPASHPDPRHRKRAGSSRSTASVPKSAWRTISRARPDVFFTGPDGSLRSNRAFCQVAGLYACDMFIGSTLQIDLEGKARP